MALRPEYQRFKDRNVLNDLELDTPIYKWMSLKYVLLMLRDSKLSFTRIADWEDVYENFFLKGNVISHGLLVGTSDIQNQMFGQSWSLCPESDALWRIYSDIKSVKNNQLPDYQDVAIRIETTARKLYDAIYYDDSCMANTFIGMVTYKDQKVIEHEMRTLKIDINDLSRQIPQHACVKRTEFSHEQEVRPIVFLDSTDNRLANHLLQYDIDINQFLDSLVIDPRLSEKDVIAITNMLVNVGVDVNKISQSQLYQYNPIPLHIE